MLTLEELRDLEPGTRVLVKDIFGEDSLYEYFGNGSCAFLKHMEKAAGGPAGFMEHLLSEFGEDINAEPEEEKHQFLGVDTGASLSVRGSEASMRKTLKAFNVRLVDAS